MSNAQDLIIDGKVVYDYIQTFMTAYPKTSVDNAQERVANFTKLPKSTIKTLYEDYARALKSRVEEQTKTKSTVKAKTKILPKKLQAHIARLKEEKVENLSFVLDVIEETFTEKIRNGKEPVITKKDVDDLLLPLFCKTTIMRYFNQLAAEGKIQRYSPGAPHPDLFASVDYDLIKYVSTNKKQGTTPVATKQNIPTVTENPEFLTIEDVARKLQLHPVTVRKAITRKEIPAYRLFKSIRIKATDLEKWINSSRVG